MMRRIVELTTSYMKDQESTYRIQGEVQHRRETLHSLILQEEETSTLAVDSEEENEEEAWVEVTFILFVINVHIQDTWQGTIRYPCTTCRYCNSFEHVIEYCPSYC
jgi:hypothetical protein